MLGATPMLKAFERAEDFIAKEFLTEKYEQDAILLVVSDGLPTDGLPNGADKVRAAADRLKQRGVTILSCFISDEDMTIPRTLYAEPSEDWSDGARLMFDCASVLPRGSVFWPHLHEHDWTAPPGSRLFAQVNQSEVLTEFVETLLGPIEQQQELRGRDHNGAVVFVSYSHADRKYVEKSLDSLLFYLRGLEHEGIELWRDDRIQAGTLCGMTSFGRSSKKRTSLLYW